MLKDKRLWIPLCVAAALAGLLGFVVDDPFGENLSSYVGAASTLILAAVTTSYVMATFQMAETSRDQASLTKRVLAKPAVDAVWHAYAQLPVAHAAVAATTTMIRQAVAAGKPLSPEAMKKLADGRLDDAEHGYDTFRDVIYQQMPSLPPDVLRTAAQLHLSYAQYLRSREELLTCVKVEAKNAALESRDALPAKVAESFDLLTSFRDSTPKWKDLGGEAEESKYRELEAQFSAAVTAFQRSLQPDGTER